MSLNPQKSIEQLHDLRKEAGLWLRGLREGKGFSQRDLAEETGTEYYTFVSQLETGRGRIAPENYLRWAKALGVEPKVFVRTLMQYYDPITHDILFLAHAAKSAE